MRTITGDRLRLLLQPHVVCLSGFRNPRAPLIAWANGMFYFLRLPQPYEYQLI